MLVTPRRYSAYVTTTLTASLLLACNIRKIYHDGGQAFGIESLFMITFVKQMILAFNYKDGASNNVTPREAKYSVVERPSLLTYCAYMFNLQSGVIGPSFEFKDWDNFMNLRGDYAKLRPFSNYLPAVARFGHGIGCVGIGIGLTVVFDPQYMLTNEFSTSHIAYRHGYMIFSMYSVQFTYYAGFKFVEAGLIACGFGYSRTPENTEIFDSVRQIKVRQCVTSTSSSNTFTCWNI